MIKSKIVSALNRIEPNPEAEKRMYQHILAKTSQAEKAPGKRQIWLILGSAAACLAIIVAGLLGTPSPDSSHPAHSGNSVAIGSPVRQAEGPEDFASIGLYMDAPEGALNVGYSILNQNIARIEFTLDGVSYLYLASSSRQDDFSSIQGKPIQAVVISEEPSAAMTKNEDGIWKAVLTSDGVKAFIINYDGASESDMRQLVLTFSAQLR